jgi:hypothetical protein
MYNSIVRGQEDNAHKKEYKFTSEQYFGCKSMAVKNDGLAIVTIPAVQFHTSTALA